MIIARQSTARTVIVGPVLDATGVAVTDGVVADFEGSVNGGDPSALNGLATLTHRGVGFYSLALTATDLATVGSFEVSINDTVNACPLKEITVIEEAVFDAFYAASAVGIPSIPANWLTTAGIADGAFTAAKFASGAFDAVWTVTTRTLSSFGTLIADIWAAATRTLTAGTNIVLAKGVGVTGFNDLSAAQVNAEADTALADAKAGYAIAIEAAILDEGDATALLAAIAAKVEEFLINEGDATATIAAIATAIRTNLAVELARIDVATSTRATQASVDDVPTNAEFNARTKPTADYFDPATDNVNLNTAQDWTGVYATNSTGHVLQNLDSSNATSAINAILNRIGSFTGTGINTVLGFFRALFNKGAGLTPSDLISGGLTGDNTTDSLEAQQDSGGGSGATQTQVARLLAAVTRKDSAATTDLAAELTLLNQNFGTGAGGFANQTESIEAIAAKIDLISGSGVRFTLTSPLSLTGREMNLIPGDAYDDDNGNAITFNFTGAPDITGKVCTLGIGYVDGVHLIRKAGQIVTAGSGQQTVKFELTQAETVLLDEDEKYGFTFEVDYTTLTPPKPRTLISGFCYTSRKWAS